MTGTAPAAPWPRGVLAAVPTPFDRRGALAAAALGPLLDDVAARGGHGVLLAGSTGEGPSLGLDERLALVRAAAAWRAARPAGAPPFALLGGSGHPAWPEAAQATAGVVAAGADAAVVLPPYYFKGVSEAGLFDWFRRVLDGAAELLSGGAADAAAVAGAADAGPRPSPMPPLRVLVYDIPRYTGVPVPTAVLRRLVDDAGPAGPLVGLKDSGGDLALTRERIAALPELAVLTGTDTHLAPALAVGGAGAITAMASLRIDLLRRVWDRAVPEADGGDGGAAPAADRADEATARADLAAAQADLDAARAVLDRWPVVPEIKSAVAARWGGDAWHVRPPLGDLSPAEAAAFARAWAGVAGAGTAGRSDR